MIAQSAVTAPSPSPGPSASPGTATANSIVVTSQELDISSLTFNLADHILADSLDPNAPHADQTLHGG